MSQKLDGAITVIGTISGRTRTRIFIARGRFSAAKDWVGSCGITIEGRHKRGDVPQMNFLTLRGGSIRIEPSVSLGDLQASEPLISLRKQSRKQRRPHALTCFVRD